MKGANILHRKKRKVHSLTGRITYSVMQEAFKSVYKNKGAPGIDRMSLNRYQINLEQNLTSLMNDLKTRKYNPSPLRRVYIQKSNGKQRPLGIPTVRDRIAQEVIRRLLEPVFELLFHNNSHGFRQYRGCHTAVGIIKKLESKGYKYVLDADIEGFFDNIPHKVIMRLLAQEIADGNILTIVEKFLKAGVIENGVFTPTTKGTPQGGVISPLFANIVLNQLDWILAKNHFAFVRYADDFVILSKTDTRTEEALVLVKSILSEIGLSISESKTHVTSFWKGFDFLGFHITYNRASMRLKSFDNFKAKVNKITRRSFNLDRTVIDKLNNLIRGTIAYFNPWFGTPEAQFRYFDKIIRRRIRCMKFKRINFIDHIKLTNRRIKKLGLKLFMESLQPGA
jgi:group II intron reverse transcriptase/maturase